MPTSKLGYSYILLCTCEVSHFVVGIPIQDVTSVTLFEGNIFQDNMSFWQSKETDI